MTSLRYDVYGAALSGDMRHAQDVVKELGITYQSEKPQPMGQQWLFFGCGNVPSKLPAYITEWKGGE